MSDAFPLTGVTGNWRKPGSYMQLLFNQGNPAGQTGTRDIVIVCAKLSSGTYTTNMLVRAMSAAEVIAGLGSDGLEGVRMFRMITNANKQCKVYILPYAETSGGSPVAASTTITIGGSAATAQNVMTLGVCGVGINTLINVGDTAINVADNTIANINTATYLPVIATGTGTGTIILTYKQKGTCGGASAYKPIRLDVWSAPSSPTTCTVPGDLGTTVQGAEGTTTNAAACNTALSAINGSGHYYFVFADTSLNATVVAWIAAQALPLTGNLLEAVTAYNGTKANAITMATARNYERLQIVWAQNCDHDPAELAGNVVAIRQKQEETDGAFIWKDYHGPDWFIQPAFDTTTWPSPSDINDGINGGLTPIEYQVGYSRLVMSVDTRTKDPTGTYIDFRSSETHRVSAMDAFAFDLNSRIAIAMVDANGGAKKLVDDPKLPNGKVDFNRLAQADFKKKMCPALITPIYVKAIRDAETASLMQRSDESVQSLQVTHSTDNRGRINAGMTMYTVDGWLQTTSLLSEGTPG